MNLGEIGKIVSISKEDYFVDEKINCFDGKYSKKQFLQIPYGTIIWAKRYKNEQEKETIGVGHAEGPFVVVGRCQKGLYCLYATSKQEIGVTSRIRLRMEDYIDYLKKDTYISTSSPCLISKKMFIETLSKLNREDLKKVDKRIKIVKCKKMFNINFEENDLPIEAGDVIELDNRIALILDCKDGYTLLPLSRCTNTNKIDINGRDYYYNFNNVFTMENIEGAKLIEFIDSCELEKVLAKRQKYLKYLSEKKKINRGSLICDGENLYYVYGENGDVWLAFIVKVNTNGQVENKMSQFTINGKQYLGYFYRNREISKKDKSYEVVDLATEDEMENIKNKKKSFLKTNSTKNKNDKKYGIDTGDIVISRAADKTSYIVVVGNQDDIIVVDKNCIFTGNYSLSLFTPRDVLKVGNTDNGMIRGILEKIRYNTYGWISEERINRLLKKYGE